jgi:hypothetical protein
LCTLPRSRTLWFAPLPLVDNCSPRFSFRFAKRFSLDNSFTFHIGRARSGFNCRSGSVYLDETATINFNTLASWQNVESRGPTVILDYFFDSAGRNTIPVDSAATAPRGAGD